MRVALVCGRFRPEHDGVSGYVARLAEHLVRSGVDPVIVPTGARPLRGARQKIRGLGVDLVHVQFAPSFYRFRGPIGALPLVLPRRMPLVTTLHEYGSWTWLPRPAAPLAALWRLEARRLLDRETGLLVPRSDRVIVTNRAHRKELVARFGMSVRTALIPIGANVDVSPHAAKPAARAALHRELGLAPATTVLVFFGFVHPVKGLRYLLEAVARLHGDGRDLHLLVVGGFESLALPAPEARAFEAELRGLIDRLGLRAQVTVTGFLPDADISRMLTGSDIAVLPFTGGVTTKSGSLLTVLAHGLPTLVTRGDTAEPELVDGENCVVIGKVRDAAAIAQALRRVLGDAALRERIAEGGADVVARHSWPEIAERHARLYADVLRERAG